MKRVRAIIIEDKKVLTIKRTKPETIYWAIPGGGVEDDETNKGAPDMWGVVEVGEVEPGAGWKNC